jgi:hypothetical protein
MRKYVACLIVAMAFLGCNKHKNIEEKIVDAVGKKCKGGSECIITMRELTDFSWDKMYVFDYRATSEDIEKVVGADIITSFEEFTKYIIFTFAGKVVFYEKYDMAVEGFIDVTFRDKEVVFDIPYDTKYRVYTPDSAVFKVEKKGLNKGVYYELHQVH